MCYNQFNQSKQLCGKRDYFYYAGIYWNNTDDNWWRYIGYYFLDNMGILGCYCMYKYIFDFGTK